MSAFVVEDSRPVDEIRGANSSFQACMRCLNAKRQCGGYENEVVGRRPYGLPSTAQVSA